MTFKDKYGEWGIVFGATEGVGKAMAISLAERGLNIVLIGRRSGKLNALKQYLESTYAVSAKVTVQDLSQENALDNILLETKDLDVGFISYVAAFSRFGPVFDHTFDEDKQMLQINIITFLKVFYHYIKLFKGKGRGGIINIGSTSGITGGPYIAQYGAGKAFIQKMTEAVAYEMQDTNVTVMVPILGATVTPSLLRSIPNTDKGKAVLESAMRPDEVMKEIFVNFGKKNSMIIGEKNRKEMEHLSSLGPDKMITMVGDLFK